MILAAPQPECEARSPIQLSYLAAKIAQTIRRPSATPKAILITPGAMTKSKMHKMINASKQPIYSSLNAV